MAKLPRIIRNTQDGQMKKLQDGGDATDVYSRLGVTAPTPPPQKTELTTGETITPAPITPTTEETIQPISVGTAPATATATADVTNLDVATPQAQAASIYSSYTVGDTPEAIAAHGTLSQESKIGDIQGAVSNEAKAQAAQGTVNEKATVKYQLAQLFSSIEEGGELPAWAAPAVRNVSAQMQQRGLGASSMAAAAITQAITEAGIPIAAADAQTYARMELTNLNNKQQTALRNAMTYAAMDTANLNVAATVAATNSKSFLAIDAQNLTQSQQANMLDFQSQVQKLTTDQAQINAAQQFNAKSQNQSDEFFTELGTQIENSNVTRKAAMEQFNADQANASARFVAQLEDSRDKFNANMAGQIDQSNANWRRVINTENTALQNETNRLNAQNLLGLSVQAQNQVWQRYRDEASWVLSRTESATQRAHQYAMQAQSNDFDDQMYQQQFRDSTYQELGKTILDFVFF